MFRGGSRGGGARAPLSESLGIDFYSGFREKKHKGGGGGVQIEIQKNPGIDFYSGFREKKHKGGGGGGAIRNPKKSRYRLL